jgi:rhodanese-related sulfurtransferase
MNKIAFAVAASLILAGPAMAGKLSPTEVAGAKTVTADEAVVLFDAGAPFVDVRASSEYDLGRVPGAVHLDLVVSFSEETLADVAGKDEPVVIYCNGPYCPRAAKGCEQAVGWGYTEVYYFRDGLPGWEAAGYPVE